MSWIPPYAVPQCQKSMDSLPLVGQGLSHLGLQFWNPTATGGLRLAPIHADGTPIDTIEIREIRQWSKTHGIKLLLTVYNTAQTMPRWDWKLARAAFVDHQDSFVESLIREMDLWELDGIDIDLEGEGHLDSDRNHFKNFVSKLSARLKPQGKILSINSFHSPCFNAPNMSWWSDWKGMVDQIQSMGYMDLYEGSEEAFWDRWYHRCEGGAAIFKYSWQHNYGRNSGFDGKVLMGMPTWVDRWGSGGAGPRAIDHLNEIRAVNVDGIALWDLQLIGPAWRSDSLWRELIDYKAQP